MLRRDGPLGGVLTLRLARPAQLNALTLALTRELIAALHAAAQDETVRVILLAGEGRAFCAGKDKDDPATGEFVDALQELARVLMQCPKPVVAAVQGWAVGAGVEMLLTCDIVLAARSARFMLPEIKIGLFGTGGVLALLPQAAGLAKAKGLLMLGEAFSAEDAERWGIVWRAVADDAFEAQVQAACTRLAQSDPSVLREIKSALHREVIDLDAVLAREAQVHHRLL
jgi:2-(1,2-epoxy-1,2-dihydrophenyl)acetyl-CoA isomerase